MVVLTIATADGVEGTAFVSTNHAHSALIAYPLAEVVRPQLIGRDALDIGAIWQLLWRQESALGPAAIGGVDVALWDIMGKIANLPVHRLLGTVRTSIPVYISSWNHEHPDTYAAEAVHWKNEGFTAYKIHPPTQRRAFLDTEVPLAVDIETARRVREAVGPQMTLMWDSPRAYSYEEALTMGRVLEELGFHWYEDPLPPDDISGYVRLRRHLHIPILATELTGGGPFNYAQWIEHKATDYLRGDVYLKGGITAQMKIVHTAEVCRLGYEPHDGFNAIGNFAQAHVVMAAAGAQYFELLTINPAGVYDFDHVNYGVTNPLVIENGALHAPTGPGLGAEVDWELIDSTRLREL
jgi:L-alanine-DL-glutamate epimerase-like enolase superfamily enzyme